MGKRLAAISLSSEWTYKNDPDLFVTHIITWVRRYLRFETRGRCADMTRDACQGGTRGYLLTESDL